MKKTEGGVTAAKGFQAASCMAGIKYENRRDMALVYSETPCRAAATFTSNVVKAAPVLWDRRIVREEKKPVHAVVVNTGIANAGTGREGLAQCEETASHAAKCLGIPADSVLVGSTGVIGPHLDMERIKAGIDSMVPALSHDKKAGDLAAEAIMTTDTHSKQTAAEITLKGVKAVIGGMAKGSGMIHPNMCTMLCYITTDAAIDGELMQKALSDVVTDTFNMISVDGDTSTNDTLILLSNGLAGNDEIKEEDEDYRVFRDALFEVTRELARMLAADGEGATKLITCNVINASEKDKARTLAKSVISSSLTKAAVYGGDANWGRILCAMGYSGAVFDPEKLDISLEAEGLGKLLIYHDGSATDYSEEEAAEILKQQEVIITADMKEGKEEAAAWGCDLTHEYVNINADYRS